MTFNTAILKTEYFPPISTFWALVNSEQGLLEINENYQKKSTGNRTQILGVNKVEVLTVPLKRGKNSKMPIREVQISYDDVWRSKHLHSIRSAYGNSPYFDYYFDPIKEILQQQHEYLVQLNRKLLDYFCEVLHIDTPLGQTAEYVRHYGDDFCDLRGAKFNQPDIPGYAPKRYNQVFEDKHNFVANISILDLLMCKGPESILYI